MDKLKKILSPGHKNDDEALYDNGSSSAAGVSSTETPASTQPLGTGSAATTLHTKPETEAKDQGILRQIVNPEGNKYDELAHGQNATAQPISSTAGTSSSAVQPVAPGEVLQSKPDVEKKDHGILRQILNPGGNKYDELAHGETATVVPSSELSSRSAGTATGATPGVTTGANTSGTSAYDQNANPQPISSTAGTSSSAVQPVAAGEVLHSNPDVEKKDHGILRQIVNPGGSKYDELAHGETATVVPASSTSELPSRSAGMTTNATTGVTAGATTGATTDSHLGRDAGIAGAGLGAAALASSAHGGNDNISSNVSSTQDRSFPLSGGSSTTQSSSLNPLSSNSTTTGGLGHDTSSSTLPHTSTSTSTAPLAASIPAVAGWTNHDHEHTPHTFAGPVLDAPAPGYVHHVQGPHSTLIANVLDPHVPGEFPTESGLDPHAETGAASGLGSSSLPLSSSSTLGGATAAHGDGIVGTGLSGVKSRELGDTTTSSQPLSGALGTAPSGALGSSGTEHHHGRNAALAGGAGAAGLGAYEATKDHGAMGSSGLTGTQPAQSSAVGSGQSAFPSSAQPLATSSGAPLAGSSSPLGGQRTNMDSIANQQPEHHYGRDAALVGGAGAAGIGAAAATRSHDSSVPASSTLGSHGAAASSTAPLSGTAASSSSTAPLSTSQQPEHHYGRDAALVGGAGAAGIGAAAAWRSHESAVPASSTVGSHGTTAPSSAPLSGTTASSSSTAPLTGTHASASSTAPLSTSQQPEHHYGREAAVAGGAGLAGIGASEAWRSHDNTVPASSTLGSHGTTSSSVPMTGSSSSSAPLTGTHASPSSTAPLIGTHASSSSTAPLTGTHASSSSTAPLTGTHASSAAPLSTSQQSEHHHGRDAAVAGGVGAGGVAAYEAADHHHDSKLEKKHEKELAKEEKKHEKELEKEEKKHEKELEKEEKKHEKEEKKHEKQLEKEQKHAEHNKLHKDPPSEEKKPSLIHRILHPGEKTHDTSATSAEGHRGTSDHPSGLELKAADEARHAANMRQLERDGVIAGGAASGVSHHGAQTSTKPSTIFSAGHDASSNVPSHPAPSASSGSTAIPGVVTGNVPKAPLSEVQANADHELNLPTYTSSTLPAIQRGTAEGDHLGVNATSSGGSSGHPAGTVFSGPGSGAVGHEGSYPQGTVAGSGTGATTESSSGVVTEPPKHTSSTGFAGGL